LGALFLERRDEPLRAYLADDPRAQPNLVERQTSVGVDLGEQVAAKTALQNATAELAERLLPKLAK